MTIPPLLFNFAKRRSQDGREAPATAGVPPLASIVFSVSTGKATALGVDGKTVLGELVNARVELIEQGGIRLSGSEPTDSTGTMFVAQEWNLSTARKFTARELRLMNSAAKLKCSHNRGRNRSKEGLPLKELRRPILDAMRDGKARPAWRLLELVTEAIKPRLVKADFQPTEKNPVRWIAKFWSCKAQLTKKGLLKTLPHKECQITEAGKAALADRSF